MKKLLLSIAFLAVALLAVAQNASFGLEGGFGLSSVSSMLPVDGAPSVKNNTIKSSLQVGALLNVEFGSAFEMQPELLYTKQGFKATVSETGELINNDPNWKVTSHYLSVPLAMKFYLLRGFYLSAGPQFSVLLSKKERLDEELEMSHIYGSHTNKVDFSVFVGMGYRFTPNMYVEGRYNHGLVEMSKLYTGGKNRNFQVSIGYIFQQKSIDAIKRKFNR